MHNLILECCCELRQESGLELRLDVSFSYYRKRWEIDFTHPRMGRLTRVIAIEILEDAYRSIPETNRTLLFVDKEESNSSAQRKAAIKRIIEPVWADVRLAFSMI